MIFKDRRRRRASTTSEYKAFRNARQRCTYPRDKKFAYYGGRGIKFLFQTFLDFWSEIGPKPSPRHSLDRINNDGNYERGNIRWATPDEQRRNRRRPEKHTLALAA